MTFNRDMNDSLRAADRDRDEIAGVLREHYAQGRLTLEEFNERSTAAYAAKTMGELRPLVADLPMTVNEPRRPDAWSPARMRLIGAVAAVAAVALVVTAVVAGHVVLAMPVWLVALIMLKLTCGRCARFGAGRRAGRG